MPYETNPIADSIKFPNKTKAIQINVQYLSKRLSMIQLTTWSLHWFMYRHFGNLAISFDGHKMEMFIQCKVVSE